MKGVTSHATARVLAQCQQVPSVYGSFDFSSMPERYLPPEEDNCQSSNITSQTRTGGLPDRDILNIIREGTLLGDASADSYAALAPKLGVRHLLAMLDQACTSGVASVPDAPAELSDLIQEMERACRAVDMSLVEDGARWDRNMFAHIFPFAVRAVFLASFVNGYAAMPLLKTGKLTGSAASGRIRATVKFFTMSVCPGALDRKGAGFNAAARIRFMHALVRCDLLRGEGWEPAVYGVPIPQVDQMPAGMAQMFLTSQRALEKGRATFNARERASLELHRYRCLLLGMSNDLIGDTPQRIVDLMLVREATLRPHADEANTQALIDSTLHAGPAIGHTFGGPIRVRVEDAITKYLLVQLLCQGDAETGAKRGIVLTGPTKAFARLAISAVLLWFVGYRWLLSIPWLRPMADWRLRQKIRRIIRTIMT